MKHTIIMGRIVFLFAITMALSFIPDLFHEAFGDWHCNGTEIVRDTDGKYMYYAGCYENQLEHSSTWHWGFRHFLWMLMGLSLFVYNTILIISSINKITSNSETHETY
jgi:hypothetical protein